MNKLLRVNIFSLFLSLFIGAFLLYVGLREYSFDEVEMAIAAMMAAYLFRAFPRTIREKGLGFGNAFGLIPIGFMSRNLPTTRVGEPLQAIRIQGRSKSNNDAPEDRLPMDEFASEEHRRQVLSLRRRLGLPSPAESPLFSIVIPAHNEQNRLPRTVLETVSWCAEHLDGFEMIIVDDGSRDETLTLARLFSRQIENIRVVACPHRGKGEAVRMGMLNAEGDYVLFMDADGATPVCEIPKLIHALNAGADIAIGSRAVRENGETVVVTRWYRKVIGRIFSRIVNALLIPGIADTQCGFKMFRRKTIPDIFPRQKIEGFAFDVEILFLAGQFGFSVVEVPVNWVNQEGSKVNLLVDSIRMFKDILRIRWLHRGESFHPSPPDGNPFP